MLQFLITCTPSAMRDCLCKEKWMSFTPLWCPPMCTVHFDRCAAWLKPVKFPTQMCRLVHAAAFVWALRGEASSGSIVQAPGCPNDSYDLLLHNNPHTRRPLASKWCIKSITFERDLRSQKTLTSNQRALLHILMYYIVPSASHVAVVAKRLPLSAWNSHTLSADIFDSSDSSMLGKIWSYRAEKGQCAQCVVCFSS